MIQDKNTLMKKVGFKKIMSALLGRSLDVCRKI
jgi:hypothetical protein